MREIHVWESNGMWWWAVIVDQKVRVIGWAGTQHRAQVEAHLA